MAKVKNIVLEKRFKKMIDSVEEETPVEPS